MESIGMLFNTITIEISHCSGKCFGRFQVAEADDTDGIRGRKLRNHGARNSDHDRDQKLDGRSDVEETTSLAVYVTHFLDVKPSLTTGDLN
jgi:hypothetical protein